MDEHTVAELEAIRKQTPRYLFRLWSDGNKPSGGRLSLNKRDKITPHGFAGGLKGHESAYHLTKDQFIQMALDHLLCLHIDTEFSSWTASFNFVASMCPGIPSCGKSYASRYQKNLYISVIDVEMLWETNQAFYVPSLNTLHKGVLEHLGLGRKCNYPEEYLVHGVVEGPWLKTIPFERIVSKTLRHDTICSFDFRRRAMYPVEPITRAGILLARRRGKLFGDNFALPMALVIMSVFKRDQHDWANGVPKEEIDMILDTIEGMHVPESFKKRDQNITDVIHAANFGDTKAATRLIQAVILHLKKQGFDIHETTETKGTVSAERAWKPIGDDDNNPLRRSMRLKEKSQALQQG